MADARGHRRAPPIQIRIYVVPTAYWIPLVLRIAATRWELKEELRSAWPARGHALGFFTVFIVEAERPAMSIALRATWFPKTVPTHQRPGGRGEGAWPNAQAAPRSARAMS